MRFAVSSWALHQTIGVMYRYPLDGSASTEDRFGTPQFDLLELPSQMRSRGYDRLELCHFHIPRTDPAYLAEFRAALSDADVTLHSLLVDDGDISHPTDHDRDATWIRNWIKLANALGAERARVIAGKQPYSSVAFDQSFSHLAQFAAEAGSVRVTIENWFDLLKTPKAVNDMLDRLEGQVGLCADFGNWDSPRKFADLPKIFARAETCHAKCEFKDGQIDAVDYDGCLAIAKSHDFDGPFVAVNGGSGDNWTAIAATKRAIAAKIP